MSASFQDRLNVTLERKREARAVAERRRAEEALAARRVAEEQADFERKMARTWQVLRAQIDEQIRVINQRSADLELVAAVQDRSAASPALAARAIQFVRRPGTLRYNLFIQLSRAGIVQYSFDGRPIYSGKIALMSTEDHDLIVNNVLDFIVSGIPINMRPNQYSQFRRVRTWRDMPE